MNNTLFLLSFLLTFFVEESEHYNVTNIQEIDVDKGQNLELPCSITKNVKWIQKGRIPYNSYRIVNGSLFVTDITKENAGLYSCVRKDDDTILSQIKVNVKTSPPALVNVSVIPCTIMATLKWDVSDTGGYPITNFTAQYRLRHHQKADFWRKVISGRSKSQRIEVYPLLPNSSYVFQIWANNKLGRGEVVEVEAITGHDSQEYELGHHILKGAETFDTRVWVAAVAVVMGTLVILATATIYALYKECHIPLVGGNNQETMELIPNIILNPGYHEDHQTEMLEPDENSNNRNDIRLNNNNVIHPAQI